ncbi:MAG: ribonuclease P protein component, partial [Flavobacteriales bacterium]|nr:ribonuclease P protein component [Flavobacteriales bacterium]
MGIKKEFRLKSKKSIGNLLLSRNRLKAFPLHVLYNTSRERYPERKSKVQVAFSAPKRIHRSAVKRNLYK